MKSTKISRFMGIGLTIALLTSLLTVAVPASAVSQPTVTFVTAGTDNKISQADADYVIQFTVANQLSNIGTNNGSITITFPSDTAIAATGIAANITAGPGWVGGVFTQPAGLGTPVITSSTSLRTITLTLNAGENIGETAPVRISITAGITNPNTAGDYTLTVKSSNETAAATSAVYTIINPILAALPGVVQVFNPTGILMGQSTGATAIADAIGASGTNYVIKVGPGTYAESPTTGFTGVTFVATGAAADTIIKGTFTIANPTTTLDGLTIMGGVAVTSNNSVIKNSSLKAASATATTTLLDIGANTVATPVTVSNTTLELGAATLKGIAALDANVVITGSTFKGVLAKTSIESNNSTLTITGSTFTGAGTGIKLNAASSSLTVSTSTFTGVTTALNVAAASTTVQFFQNTITSPTGDGIIVGALVTNGSILKGNTITGIVATKWALNVAAAASANVSAEFNNLTGNIGNVKAGATGDTTTVVDATHNWWGSASGPVASTISGTKVATAPFLTGAVSSSTDLAIGTTTLSARTTAGVDVDATLYAPTLMAAAKYAANPTASTPPFAALAGGYYDVFVAGPIAVVGNSVVIKLYNTAISATTQAYYWNGLQGKWLKATTQGNNLVNINGSFTFVTATSTSTPSIADLSGTPFVLVTEVPVVVPGAIVLSNPAIGATGVALKPVLSWTPYTGAIWYEVTMSEYPDFSIIEWSHNVGNGTTLPAPTVYGVGTPPSTDETLKYGTTYFWRVRGVTGQPVVVGSTITVPAGPWVVGAFTTMAAPAAPPTQQVIVTQAAPPAVTATVETTKEVLVPQPIPNWMLMTIIVIGAVLIIALIVLIVRTRRVA